jgi:hypothetical protein
MDQGPDSPVPPRRLITPEAKARFLDALRAGAGREEAAEAGDFPLNSFYAARMRDPVLRRAWDWAVEISVAEMRTRRAAASPSWDDGRVQVAPQRGRVLQRRTFRHVRFTPARRRNFLAHFASNADVCASAAVAGVSAATVYYTRRKDPDFAREMEETLREAYRRLEEEALRQRLAAQKALREVSEVPAQEAAAEFERVLKLLQRLDRRGARAGCVEGERRPAEHQAWTFEEAITALDKRLRFLGLRRSAPAIEGAAEDKSGAA